MVPDCVRWDGTLAFVRVGKIEHAMEGCACPMGPVARAFLNHLAVGHGQWVLVDTEARVEHFGRGVLEGVDAVLMVVDPSRDAVILAEKGAAGPGGEKAVRYRPEQSGRRNRSCTERGALGAKGIEIRGALPYAPAVARASVLGEPLAAGAAREQLDGLVCGIRGMVGRT